MTPSRVERDRITPSFPLLLNYLKGTESFLTTAMTFLADCPGIASHLPGGYLLCRQCFLPRILEVQAGDFFGD